MPDYQCDMTYFGLMELPNVNLYATSSLWYLHKGNNPEDILKLYGKGFSLYNRLENNVKIDTPEEITYKIKSRFYDRIIYGSIIRCSLYIEEVLKTYKRDEIIFIDGEDTDFSFFSDKRYIKRPYSFIKQYKNSIFLSNKGYYFKRELRECDRKYFYPISFAIPSSRIINFPLPNKTREKAYIIPGDLSTYVYENEEDYHNGYAISKFGITQKKAGWDCLRHYEILANACIPYFKDIEKCPIYTMHTFPKNIIVETNRLIETNQLSNSIYRYYASSLLSYTKEFLTTKKLAEYILSF